jgi:HlyD family secretion protein
LKAEAEVGGRRQGFVLGRVAGASDARGLDGFFRLTEANPALRVGSLVTLRLERPAVEGAIAVPYGALYGGNSVYKIDQDRLKMVPVEVLGERPGNPPSLLVRGAGLRADDILLATHLPNATTGLRVEPTR